MSILLLPSELLNLVLQNLELVDILSFAATCRFARGVFRPDRLAWVVDNFDTDDGAEMEMAVSECSYLLRCYALRHLLREFLDGDFKILSKYGASLAAISHGKLLEDVFVNEGPCGALDNVLFHGATFDQVPSGINRLLEEEIYNDNELSVDLLLEHGASIRDLPNGVDQALNHCAYRWQWENIAMILERAGPLHLLLPTMCRGIRNLLAEQGPIANEQFSICLKHVPNLLNILLADVLRCEGRSSEYFQLIDRGASLDGISEAVLAVEDPQGTTVFLSVALFGDVDVGRELVRRVHLDHADDEGMTALHIAARNGQSDFVDMLLEAGADPTIKIRNGSTPWILAAAYGSIPVLRVFLSHGLDDHSAVDREGKNALHYAASGGHAISMQFLLENGTDISSKDIGGRTAIYVAAAEGIHWVIDLLIKYGADIEAATSMLWTPLLAACAHGHLEAAKLLIERGANINARNEDTVTPVLRAAGNGHLEVVKMLYESGADPRDTTTNAKQHALHLAAQNQCMDVIKFLVGQGTDIGIVGNSGETPLHLAAERGSLEAAKYLVLQGSNLTVKRNDGCISLNMAAGGGHLDLCEYLLEEDASTLEYSGTDGLTPLLAAARSGNIELVQYFVTKYADTKARCAQGRSALLLATVSGDVETVRYLHGLGLDINMPDYNGTTGIAYSSWAGNMEMVQALLQLGADPNVQSSEKTTAITGAALGGHTDIMELLLGHGARIVDQTPDVASALCFAIKNGSVDATKLLLASGVDVNVTFEQGFTPLSQAISMDDEEVAVALVEGGANVNGDYLMGFSVIHAAATLKSPKLLDIMLDKGANMDAVCHMFGSTPLHVAISSRKAENALSLITRGCDLNIKTHEGETALHHAAERGMMSTVRALVEAKASVQVETLDGTIPVYLALVDGHMDVAAFLDEICPPMEAPRTPRDKFDRTPIHLAVHKVNSYGAKPLIQRGLDTTLLDGYGQTALDWIASNPTKFPDVDISGHEPTPDKIRLQVLQNSVRRLAQNLLNSDKRNDSPGFDELGRCFLFLGEEESAKFAFQLRIKQFDEDSQPTHDTDCTQCQDEKNIFGPRFTCTRCPRVDLCGSCMQSYSSANRLACEHDEFVHIASAPPDFEVGVAPDSLSVEVQQWLRTLLSRYTDEGQSE